MPDKEVIHVFWENKVGGAEMIGHQESMEGNTQIFFLRTDTGFIRLMELVKLLHKANNLILITSLWKSHFCVLFVSFFISGKYKWIMFIHSTKFFHFIDQLVTRAALLRAHLVIADGPESHSFISRYTRLPIEVYRISLKNLMIAPWNSNVSVKYSFLFIGRIVSYKRLDRLIVLAELLSAKGVDYCMTVAGPIESEYSLDMISLNRYGINYVGIVSSEEEKARLYKGHNFLINLSDVEGLGLSVVEGICNGLIPVITKVGEMPNYCLEPHSIVWDPTVDINDLVRRIVNFTSSSLLEHARHNFINLESYLNSKGTLLRDILKKIEVSKPFESFGKE